MKILIAGGTGFVGEFLRQHLLSKYHEVFILSRNVKSENHSQSILWNPSEQYIDLSKITKFDAIINLSGENIGSKFWTKKRKKELLDSRVESTNFLLDLIVNKKIETNYFLQASAIGIYGNRDIQKLDEESELGDGFLASIVKEWEKAAGQIPVKKSILRLGVVFHSQKGAFRKLILGLKFRFCLIFGNGLNYISWIDIDDLSRMILFLIENEKTGVYNAVSPQPIQNIFLLKKFNQRFGELSITIMIPAKIIHWILGDFSEILLYSQRVSSRKIQSEGFEFYVKSFKDFLTKYSKRFS